MVAIVVLIIVMYIHSYIVICMYIIHSFHICTFLFVDLQQKLLEVSFVEPQQEVS